MMWATPPEVRTPSRGDLGHLAWGLSLTLHGAAVIALCWNAPPAPRYTSPGRTTERSIELFDGGSFRSQPIVDKNEDVQPAVFLTSSTVHATLSPSPELQAFAGSAPQPIQELPPQPVDPPADAAANLGEPNSRTISDDFRVETQVFGVRGHGKRFVYVFDRSASMEGRPLEAAKRELIASLRRLKSIHQFQIIFYNQEPLAMPLLRGRAPQMAFGDEQGQRLAALFVGGIFADGGTDHVQALKLALQMRPDVIFFLTDAEEPRMSAADLREIRGINQATTINTIEFGVGEAAGGYNFLHQLAAENGGQHAFVDLGRLAANAITR